MRFDPAEDDVGDFFALEGVRKAFRSTSAKGDFLQGRKSGNRAGDFWSCGSQPFPVLLGRENRDAENRGALDQTHARLDHLVFLKNGGQQSLLNIDDNQAALRTGKARRCFLHVEILAADSLAFEAGSRI